MAKDSKRSVKDRGICSRADQDDECVTASNIRCPGSGIFGKAAKFENKVFHKDPPSIPLYSSVIKKSSADKSAAKPRSVFYTSSYPDGEPNLSSAQHDSQQLIEMDISTMVGGVKKESVSKWNNFAAEDEIVNAALQAISPPIAKKQGTNEKYTPLSTSLPKSTTLWTTERPTFSNTTGRMPSSTYDSYGFKQAYLLEDRDGSPSSVVGGTTIDVGDRVNVTVTGKKYAGVVRTVDDDRIQLELDDVGDKDKKDSFLTNKTVTVLAKECRSLYQDFGGIKCPPVVGVVSPMEIKVKDMQRIIGRNKGIQGHYNSCYLDATLFSMFAFNSTFDSLLYRKKKDGDIEDYNKIRSVLNDKIVNPLRKEVYVRADRVMELRELLDKHGSVSGLTCEEKDPEEFLNSLLQQTLRHDPLLKLSSSQDSYFYQLFVEKNDKIQLPTVQHLLELSLHNSNVKLKELPSCLIILMPRFGKSFKVYPRIFPPLHLDMTEIIENNPRLCCICGTVEAVFECLDCFHEIIDTQHRLCSFCKNCCEMIHQHADRKHHKPTKLTLPPEYISQIPPSIISPTMDLFAVICIETSHYVSFVKCCNEPDAPWCFFDSMADRKGEQGGYNIPEITHSPDLDYWLSDEGYEELNRFYSGVSSAEPPKHKLIMSSQTSSTDKCTNDLKGHVKMFGKYKGIQGHYNSCYLDSTLMSMFAFNSSFDYLLGGSSSQKSHIRTLIEDVINSLKQDGFTPSDKVMALREEMDSMELDKGLTEEEKDPEEFLNILFDKVLKTEPLIQFTSGQESFIYQIFVEDSNVEYPTVQHLLEKSMHLHQVKLCEIPENLLLIMPRFGKGFKIFPKIFSNLYLDVREIIDGSVRICFSCGDETVEYECSECFTEINDMDHRLFAYCSICNRLIQAHLHQLRKHHKPSKIEQNQQKSVPKHNYQMELYAVICIETSHFVTFLKCEEGFKAEWGFSDSMADREGDDVSGINIPEVRQLNEDKLSYWLSDEGYSSLKRKNKEPPRLVKRLLKDVYMCMYRRSNL
ncbi:hypothetical protein CHUAL_003969 [Chamberlinius hualienensis]